MPSTVWSFRLIRSTEISAGKLFGSTAKPWFCDVISTLPDSKSLTGWFAPRWPNFNLKVLPPNARPRIWWPRQIPKIGNAAVHERFHLTHNVIERRRVAGTIGQKNTRGFVLQRVGGGGGGRQYLHAETVLPQPTQDVVFQAVIKGDNRNIRRRQRFAQVAASVCAVPEASLKFALCSSFSSQRNAFVCVTSLT